MKIYHPYHLVNSSPWPFISSTILFILASTFIMYLNNYVSIYLLIISFILLLLILYVWFKNIIAEGTYIGAHTSKVQSNLNIGFYLFLFSEILIFASLFISLFFTQLNPTIALGNVWPPIGILKPNSFTIPLFNTYILLLSGIFITWSHHALFARSNSNVIIGLILTILSGIIFTFYQVYEYYYSTFTITDGLFGSIFYMLTGLHGLHVIMGTLFLIVCLFRFFFSHFSQYHSLGFNFSIYYWHMIDVVWLFVFLFVYVL